MNEVIDIINKALRGLFGFLCEIIYPAIAKLYDLFIELGSLVHTDYFEIIYNKISLIIGIFMIFRVTFWLIESLINPDVLNDKEKKPGNLIKKILIVVVLLATTPSIFGYAFEFQTKVLKSNIIENIISVETKSDVGKTGRLLAADLFGNFYKITKVDNEYIIPENSKCGILTGKNGLLADNLRNGNTFKINNACLAATAKDEGIKIDNADQYFVIDFNGLFATAVGIFVFWMVLMYCISLGTRYFQLIYLQVVAPIPIMCYLAPGKDNMFSKWVKQCTTTYLDLFIRVAIISFVMLLCEILLGTDKILKSFDTDNFYIEVFLVIGLLTFAKKAPELIQELLPKSMTKASGDFGLSLKKRSESMLGGKFMYSTLKRAPGYVAGGFAGAAAGAALGVVGGKGVGSRLVSGLTGAARGFSTGSKKGNVIKNVKETWNNQKAQNSKMKQWRIEAGKGENDPNTLGDWTARKTNKIDKLINSESRADRTERSIKTVESMKSTYKNNKSWRAGKIEEDAIPLYIYDKQNPNASKFTTMTQLKADRDRLKSNYELFDQNKGMRMSEIKSRISLTPEQQQLFKNIARNKVNTLTFDDKKNLLISSYKEMGRSSEEAARMAENDLNDAIKNPEESAVLNELITERLAKEQTENFINTETDKLYEQKRKEAYNEWQHVENLINENGDPADFTYFAKHIADKTSGKHDMFINELKQYNAMVDSGAASVVGMDNAEKMSEEDIREAYEIFERVSKTGDVSNEDDRKKLDKLVNLSKMYNGVMKSVDTKITTLKMSDEYNRDKANDHFSGGGKH